MHPSGAKALANLMGIIGTAEAVPFQDFPGAKARALLSLVSEA
jgi:hypothetical protein